MSDRLVELCRTRPAPYAGLDGAPDLLSPAKIPPMPSPLPLGGARPDRLLRMRLVLLIDFINPFGFDGADRLAGPAVEAPASRKTANRESRSAHA